jgi:hypothetical protein
MSTKDNGGPAFPCDVFDPEVNGPEQHEGMTLRDYFAAKAMTSLIGMLPWVTTAKDGEPSVIAKRAYEVADAMLKARAA